MQWSEKIGYTVRGGILQVEGGKGERGVSTYLLLLQEIDVVSEHSPKLFHMLQ